MKGWKTTIPANGIQGKACTAKYITDIEIKTKTVRRDNNGYFIKIKGTMRQEDLTLINIHDPI